MRDPVVILGCGYTGRRVAALLGGRVALATTRHGHPGTRAWDIAEEDLSFLPLGARILYSIPVLAPGVMSALSRRSPVRIVYLSTTSVYGATRDVDENTAAGPRTAPEQARVQAENMVLTAGCSVIVLRPAAIYGPGRGVHVKMQSGSCQLAGTVDNFVSRIHVDDLANICVAALDSDLAGIWPVADEEPCPSREIAEFCANLLGVPMPPGAPPSGLHPTRQADRKVDGSAVLRILGVTLRYPSYRQGIPASL